MKSRKKKVKRAKLRKGCGFSVFFSVCLIIGVIVGFAIFGLNAYIQETESNQGVMIVNILFLGLFYFLAIAIYGALGALASAPIIIAAILDGVAASLSDDRQPKFRKFVIAAIIMDILGAVTVGFAIMFAAKNLSVAIAVASIVALPLICKFSSCIAFSVRKSKNKPLIDVLPAAEQIIPDTNVRFDSLKDFSSKKFSGRK